MIAFHMSTPSIVAPEYEPVQAPSVATCINVGSQSVQDHVIDSLQYIVAFESYLSRASARKKKFPSGLQQVGEKI
jgi:hypothetical protein